MDTPRNRPSGLAVVGYGLTLVGFIQVAVTIAPYVASKIPEAGAAATVVGVAVALSIDVVWASLGHATTRLAQTRQWAATAGFGVATGVAVVASTLMLATVGHMGPWSVIPVLACVLLVADGIRGLVVVSDATATEIRAIADQIRDDRATARIQALQAAHEETIAGFQESARLAARTASLAEIKVTVERAQARASRRLSRSQARYGEGAVAYQELVPVETPALPVARAMTREEVAEAVSAKPLPHAVAVVARKLGPLPNDEVAEIIGADVADVTLYLSGRQGATKVFAQRERARKAGVENDAHTWGDLLAKAGDECGLCGLWLDTTFHGTEPDSVSIDHIEPISKGGGNVIDNVQLVHLSCNLDKGTNPVEVARQSVSRAGLALVASSSQVSQMSGDEIDAKIRELLEQDPPLKPAEIAEALSMHRATVYRRLKTMKEQTA